MQATFLFEDVINTMITLETLGQAHYEALAQLTKDYASKDLFMSLSRAEGHHRALYEQFKIEMVPFEQDSVDSSYGDYIAHLLKQSLAFVQNMEEHKTFEQSLETAFQLERDTISLLQELKKITLPHFHGQIDQIIEQEEMHLKLLQEL